MENAVELRWVISVIRRWLWLVVGCTLVSATSAFVLASRMPPVYNATATLLVRPSLGTGASEYNALFASERLALTYSQMLSGWPVMEAVITRLGLKETPHALAQRIRVNPVEDTQLIRLTATSSEPKEAALLADTIAEAFVEYIQALQVERYADFLASVREQIAELSAVMDETQSKIDTLGTSRTTQEEGELVHLETILAGYRSTYATLLQNYEQMRLTAAQSAETVMISERAQVPEIPVQRRMLYTTLAAVVGAMVAVGVAFLLEHLDDTVKTRDDVSRMLGLTTLGTISRLAEKEEKLVVLAEPHSPVAEAFRVLATNIRFSNLDRPLRTVLVTSPGPSEGKSIIAANLAAAMAQMGLSVVAVDADLRRSQLSRLFDLDPCQEGLTGAVLGGSVEGLLQPTQVERLAILTTGEPTRNPTRLLGSQRVQEVLDELVREADMILIDSPPVLPVADAALLARRVDGLLLVLEAGRTRWEVARHAVECVHRVRASLLGVVLNAVPARGNTYHYSYYEYRGDENARQKRRPEREHRDHRDGYRLGRRVAGEIVAQMLKLGDALMSYPSGLMTRLRRNGNLLERQDAENAARRDLPAIARARSLARMKERLVRQFDGPEPPSSNKLADMVGQRLGTITGAAMSGRTVRNYLALLTLPLEAQELAEAASIPERQLRPLVRLDVPREQVNLVRRIVREKLTGSEVEQAVEVLRAQYKAFV